MKRIAKHSGAIEPTSIDKATPELKFGDTVKSAYYGDLYSRFFRSSLTRDPLICGHERQRFIAGSGSWRCMACGIEF